jgi:type VI secretion system protein ImpA
MPNTELEIAQEREQEREHQTSVDLAHCPHEWRQPVAGDLARPCAANLEYDTDYAVLQSQLSPKVQVQYGDFTVEPEPPDWGTIERQARALSQRTRDITVLSALTRARTRRAGALGLREGLAILHAQLHLWPEHVHPQTQVDGEHDPLVRANALAALADPQGLLADIREVTISTSAASPLTVKDVERALGPQTSAYNHTGPDAASVRAQLRQLHSKQNPQLQALQHSAQLAAQLQSWSEQHLQQDAPDLSPLTRLLAYLQQFDTSATKVQAEAVDSAGTNPLDPAGSASPAHPITAFDLDLSLDLQNASTPTHTSNHTPTHTPTQALHNAPPNARHNALHQREHIRALLGQVIAWIEDNEPSSPVSIVLRQAQNLWGKRYAEIIAAVPPELLAQWDVQLSQGEGRV